MRWVFWAGLVGGCPTTPLVCGLGTHEVDGVCVPDPPEDADADGATEDIDCDDDDAARSPLLSEVPYNGIDDDCDPASVDDDLDGDGFRYDQDCDDLDAQRSPGLTEVPYDGLDNDCDAATPDDDLDGDGAPIAADCDDTRADVGPEAVEAPYNGVDDDCDLSTLDDDLDQDGSLLAADCADDDPAIGPAITEAPYDLVDNDCDPATPDDDLDGDGVLLVDDCDDEDAAVSPLAPEIPFNGLDDDCDPATSDTPGPVELLDVTTRFLGTAAGDQLGNLGLASLGDLDGDGVPEIALGAYFTSFGGPEAGAAWIVHGPYAGDRELASEPLVFIGEDASATGYSLDAAGDMDGDGVTDLIVAAHEWDGSGANIGKAYLVSGALATGGDLEASAFASFVGSIDYERAGSMVAGAGDLDGDGLADVVIGAPGENTPVDGRGAVYVVLGPVAGDLTLATDADATLVGAEFDPELGVSVDGAGDTDGDGIDDLIVGAYQSDAGATDAGAAFVVAGPIPSFADTSTATATLGGAHSGDAAGNSVAGIGDWNGDGLDDVAVGAHFGDGPAMNVGAIYVVLGAMSGASNLNAASFVATGPAVNSLFGVNVASAGDVDGDGALDVVVSAPATSTTGAAYVFLAGAAGAVPASDADGSVLGEAPDDQAGRYAVGIGDADGDGLGDLLVSAPDAEAGKVYLVSGADLW